MTYRGYDSKIEYSEEDNILHGKILGIRDVITFEASSTEDLEAEFKAAVDDYIAWCEDEGQEPCKVYGGNVSLRITQELHRELAIQAESTGTSVNALISQIAEAHVKEIKAKKDKPGVVLRLVSPASAETDFSVQEFEAIDQDAGQRMSYRTRFSRPGAVAHHH